MKVSVIIPTLNEEGVIAASIESAVNGCGGGSVEVIVSDGGSSDRTCRIAGSMGARVIECPRGRGEQMDRASKVASGEVLLFLHADSRLPPGWYDAVRRALEDEEVVGGGFTLSIDSPGRWFRIVELGVRLRSRWLGLIYGDQAIFARKSEFLNTGGFRRLPLMEDVDCVNRLKSRGRLCVLEERVTTSGRRWARYGTVANTLRNGLFLLLYFLGVSPQRLYLWYYGTGS